jgi:hypothetical protein
MSMTPEELSRLRELCEKASDGPWFWNSYNRVVAQPFIDKDEEASEAAPEDCNWPNRYQCKACVTKQGTAPNGSSLFTYRECAAPINLYEADCSVCWVPAHHGDTAIGRHAADAEFIEAARTALPQLLDEVERLREEVEGLKAIQGLPASLVTVLRDQSIVIDRDVEVWGAIGQPLPPSNTASGGMDGDQ